MHRLLDALQPFAVPAARRRAVAAGAGAAVALSIAAIVLVRPAPAEQCRLAAREIAPIWTLDRARQARSALAGISGIDAAFPVFDAAVARWRDAWEVERAGACRAGPVSSAASVEADAARARIACLEGLRRQVGAFFGALEGGAGTKVEELVASAQALPGPSSCASMAQSPVVPRESQARAAELRELLESGTGLRWAGKSAEARARVDQVLSAARAEGLVALEARALLELGRIALAGAARHAEARAHFEAACQIALEHADEGALADGLIGMVEVEASDGERPTAERLGGLAAAALRRRGGDLARRSQLDSALCRAAERKGAGDRGLELCERSRAGMIAAFGPDDLRVAWAENRLGTALFGLGRHEEAEARFRAAIDLAERVLGKETPAADVYRSNVAHVWIILGRASEAEPVLRALSVRQPENAMIKDGWAWALETLGASADAVRVRYEVLELCNAQANRQLEHLQHIRLLSPLVALGRFDEAETQIAKAEAMDRPIHDFDQVLLAIARAQIARSRGRTAEARAAVDRAEGFVARLPDDPASRDLRLRIASLRAALKPR